ncbi:MAG: hypothetical protein ACR2JW_10910 [Thermomicrobiales bacterium]
MRSYSSARRRTRWITPLFVVVLILSIAFGSIATRADAPTATPDNTVGGLGAPPPTPVPAPTTAPTATVAPTATSAPITAASTPAGTSAAPAAAAAAPASATSGTPAATGQDGNAQNGNGQHGNNDDVGYEDNQNRGNFNNIVKVNNKTDNRLRVKAKIQLNRIPGDTVEPQNDAEAYGSCTDCQTFAVALQIDLRSRTATTVAPQNVAVALNVKCTRCTTVADAYQYVVPVDDPMQVPDNVKDLINQMQQQLNAVAHDKDETVGDAEAKINAVIAQFKDLGQSLYQQRDQKSDDDSPGATVPPDATVLTPTPTTAPQNTPTPTP